MQVERDLLIEFSKGLKGNDKEFFLRVFNNQSKYEDRLKAIKFFGKERVLDAGFGMGQWLLPLTKLNHDVCGIEFDTTRVQLAQDLTNHLGIGNLEIKQGSTENLPYSDNSFDAIFCYGVLFVTDIKKSLLEFYRVLKKGGVMYFSMNALGWYLMCIMEEHNKTVDYDPRQKSIEALKVSLEYFFKGSHRKGNQYFMTKNMINELLLSYGLKNIIVKNEGEINFIDDRDLSFYPSKEYLGEDFIYDVHCQK